MENIFTLLIQQLNSSVFTLIAILMLAFWLIYKAGGWVHVYTNLEHKMDKIEIKTDSIQQSIFKVEATTNLLYQAHLQSNLSGLKAHSPVSLTEKGDKISKAIMAEVKINAHWDDIKKKIEEKKALNPYDIQTISMDIARECFDTVFTTHEQNQVKTYAYTTGINLLEIYAVFGIIIRDRIFKENNIQIEKMD